MKICIVGVGLIGGSIIKALYGKEYELYGWDISEDVMTSCYEQGLIVNERIPELEEMDVVFICLYPEATIEFIRAHMNEFKSDGIVTDVAGLKLMMMEEILKDFREDLHFIGGHPMAGREGQGFGVSTADIFTGANYFLVHEHVSESKIDVLKSIVKSLGCGHIEVMDAKSHDDIIAYTSHMPHILSTAYMVCDRFEKTRHCVAGSFRDMTRVSDINARLWSELIMDNKSPVLHEIKEFKKALEDLENRILSDDINGVAAFLDEAGAKKRGL